MKRKSMTNVITSAIIISRKSNKLEFEGKKEFL